MATSQCSLLSMSTLITLPCHELRPPLQQCRRIMRRAVLDFSHNSKDCPLVSFGSSCRRDSYFPLESIGREKNSSRVCLAAADPPSSMDSFVPAAPDSQSDRVIEEASITHAWGWWLLQEKDPKSFWQNWGVHFHFEQQL